MPVLVGVFERQAQAEAALLQLTGMGIDDSKLALIANVPEGARAPAGAEGAEAPVRAEASAPTATRSQETDERIDNAALGAAIGFILGGGMMGPVGLVVGALAGGGLAALLTSRGMHASEAEQYAAYLREGRYLLAVELDEGDPREAAVRALLQSAGAEQVAREAEPTAAHTS
jgi:uncharacterized protein YcfJ